MLRSEAISAFLRDHTHSDLADLYSRSMEVQVNAAQDGGERVGGEFRKKQWRGWTDAAGNVWKSFRVPRGSFSNPEPNDSRMTWDLSQHCEGIGMTGWNWERKISKWVAFDFDAITGHSEDHKSKLTQDELQGVLESALKIPWVSVRKSTSGRGLHLYVFLPDIPTQNHNEHAAVGRAILGKMSALAGHNFKSKVDICGQNMWVWHRKMKGTDGLKLIQAGSVIPRGEVPSNWKDHLQVVTGSRRKNLPQDIPESEGDRFEAFTGQRPRVPLDASHKALLEWLRTQGAMWWWDSDHHMLVTHTTHLEDAHKALELRGIFETLSKGSEKGNDHNCFCFPMRNGAWSVRRYGKGVSEHDSWDQDESGWTRCYLNLEPTLQMASRSQGGIEDPKGGFIFKEAIVAAGVVENLGTVIDVPGKFKSRMTKVKEHKDGRLVVEIKRESDDTSDGMEGWLAERKAWVKIVSTPKRTAAENEVGEFDDAIRHMVTPQNENYGWAIQSEGHWHIEPLVHVKSALASLGYSNKEVTSFVGAAIFKPWKLVNKPFEPEYPGDREWNRNAAQLKYTPTRDTTELTYPTWMAILNHVGKTLDDAIADNGWCKANNIKTGADYLKCWIAALFQNPYEPLPYLFLYGPENSGKSILHEALALLITSGYKRADAAITNPSGFNAELEGGLICVVEEINLSMNKGALNRIKDWVTSREILIHRKNETPYHIPNTTHWIQCSNDHKYCPVFPGDTRITSILVNELEPQDMIPKRMLIPKLEKEAPDFLAEILDLEIPESHDRLMVPVLESSDKHRIQDYNETELQRFIKEFCKLAPGYTIKYSEFCEKFYCIVDEEIARDWSKHRIGRELPHTVSKGRYTKDNAQNHLGNIAWKDADTSEPRARLVLDSRGFLKDPPRKGLRHD